MGCAIGSRMLRMNLTGSEYRVQPPRLIQAHWKITRQAQPEDTTSTWNPRTHTSSKTKQFCLVLSSTLWTTEPAFSAFTIICLESKFTSCQSFREQWATPMDGCCGTRLEIKETSGSDRYFTSAALSHFRYDPSWLWSAYLLPHKTLWVYKWLCSHKAICNCRIKFTLKYLCRVFLRKYVWNFFFAEFTFPQKTRDYNVLNRNMGYLK